jgi:lipopolysaccharide exporter
LRSVIFRLYQTGVKSEFVRNTAKLTGGTAVAQIIMILASPVLSRIYSPEDFGTFALYNSIVAVLLIISTVRYDMGIMIAQYRKQALGLLFISFILLTTSVIVSWILILLFQNIFINYFSQPDFDIAIAFIPITVLFLGAYQILASWSNREKEFSAIAISRIVQNSTNIFLAIIFGLIFQIKLGLILGNLAGAIFALFFIWIKQKVSFVEIKTSLNKKKLKYILREFKDFPKYSFPTAFLDTFSVQLPVFLISQYFSSEITGHYSIAYRILSLPITFVGVSVGQVFYQKLTETYYNNGDCRKLIIKTWKTLFFIGLVPMVVLLLFGKEIFILVFGEAWGNAGKFASILSIPLYFTFCSSPTSSAYAVFRIQHLSLLFGVFSVILRPLAFYIGFLQRNISTSLILLAFVEITLIIIYNIVLLRKVNTDEIDT